MTSTLLSDKIVPSSRLGRNPGKVLREAKKKPVTVTNPNGVYVILDRELASDLFLERDHLSELLGLSNYVLSRFCGAKETPFAAGFRWLAPFDKDEVMEFVEEFCNILRSSPEELADVVHEWQQSALALDDSELLEANDA